MDYKGYKIIIVCANMDNGMYGDIYTSYDECKTEHPKDTIEFGYYVESPNDYENTPDWFDKIEDAMHWIETK